MTRETKVGLLVGMGVILLIGIIISDHLSVVQQQSPADFTEFASRAQESINPLVKPEAEAPLPAAPTRESVLQRLPGAMQPVPTPAELQAPQWQPSTVNGQQPSPLQELPRAYQLAGNLPPTQQEAQAAVEAPAAAAGDPQVPTLVFSRRGAEGLFEPPAAPSQQPADTRVISAQGPSPFNLDASGIFASAPPTPVPALPMRGENSDRPAVGSEIIHYVAPGETLFEIAKKYYGNGDYWRVIVEHNRGRVRDNGQVNQGVRLVIPNRAAQANLGPDFIPVQREGVRRIEMNVAARRATASGSIEVEPGDTLTRLASKHLGDGNRWKELFDANRDQLDRPEALRVGMKLVLPGQATPTVGNAAPQPAPQRETRRTGNAKEYTVESGDNLAYIAEVTLGSRDRWREIYDANKDKLSSPDALQVGQKLRIP